MSKFGELIDLEQPVLLDFFTTWSDEETQMSSVLKDVAAAVGDKAKVIKIDVEKNKALAEALKINGVPTLILYKNGEMVWRHSGEQDANTLISIVQKYI
ncbi:co-chaperone YbbN [Mesonia sp. K7]|uniref:thioredoxin family protein n=1 Tax=Mesonia sp. K7 TaxID=2218606 RepID=UPI000DA863CB|nr:thioredoxin family protein [Mesonia sp. K7]PZD78790.1 thioredoxin [Mesonia sp. K7]